MEEYMKGKEVNKGKAFSLTKTEITKAKQEHKKAVDHH